MALPVPVPTTGPVPAPPPTVVASIDYDRVRALVRDEVARVYDQGERVRLDADAQRLQLGAKLDALAAQLKQHDEQPSWMGKVFGSRYTQIVMGAAAAWFTAQQTAK